MILMKLMTDDAKSADLLNGLRRPQMESKANDYNYHGCLTGDCPHTQQLQCDRALKDHWKESLDEAQAEIAELKSNLEELGANVKLITNVAKNRADKLTSAMEMISVMEEALRDAVQSFPKDLQHQTKAYKALASLEAWKGKRE